MKSKVIGRKQLLTFSLVFALTVAVFVNWYYTKPQNNNNEPNVSEESNLGDAQYVNSNSVQSENFFETAEFNRKKARDESIEHLNDIINDVNVDDETKIFAREKLVKISEQIKVEGDIETLISAQVKSKCVVLYNNESIEVILPKGIVDDTLVVKIKDIILSKTKLTANKITIIETK